MTLFIDLLFILKVFSIYDPCIFNAYTTRYSTIAIISRSFTTRKSLPSCLTSVPAYFSNKTVSPTLTANSAFVPFSSIRPSPTAIIEPV